MHCTICAIVHTSCVTVRRPTFPGVSAAHWLTGRRRRLHGVLGRPPPVSSIGLHDCAVFHSAGDISRHTSPKRPAPSAGEPARPTAPSRRPPPGPPGPPRPARRMSPSVWGNAVVCLGKYLRLRGDFRSVEGNQVGERRRVR